MSSYLELNPESIKEKNSSYSSLTDLYHVELFTNQFQDTIEIYRIEEKQEYNKVYDDIFMKNYIIQVGKERKLKEELFLSKMENTIKADYKTKQVDSTRYYGVTGFTIMLLFVVLFIKYYSKKKKEKLNYVVNSNHIA